MCLRAAIYTRPYIGDFPHNLKAGDLFLWVTQSQDSSELQCKSNDVLLHPYMKTYESTDLIVRNMTNWWLITLSQVKSCLLSHRLWQPPKPSVQALFTTLIEVPAMPKSLQTEGEEKQKKWKKWKEQREEQKKKVRILERRLCQHQGEAKKSEAKYMTTKKEI